MTQKIRYPRLYIGLIVAYAIALFTLIKLPHEVVSDLPFLVKVVWFLFIVGTNLSWFALMIYDMVKDYGET